MNLLYALPPSLIDMADGWEQVDGLSAAKSYASDVKQHMAEGPQAYWPSSLQCPSAAAGSCGAAPGGEDQSHHDDVLSLQPPHWLPDSYASACGGCHLQFVALRRLKHHCRWVGTDLSSASMHACVCTSL